MTFTDDEIAILLLALHRLCGQEADPEDEFPFPSDTAIDALAERIGTA